MNYNPILQSCRSSYLAVRSALPWLDASCWPEEAPAFGSFALPIEHETVKAAILRADLAGTIRRACNESKICLWRWIPSESGPLTGLEEIIREMIECQLPMVVRQTDLSFDELEVFAIAHPQLAVILESGPRKLLYHIHHIESRMLKCPNLYLSTYNFCNWLGLERFRSKGLLDRLLFGSHAPRCSQDAGMGPIIMSGFTWEEKCAIAGNNLRRLLSIPFRIHSPQEYELDGAAGRRCPTFSGYLNPLVGRGHPCPAAFLKFPGMNAGENFIIDAHAHNVLPGDKSLFGFPTPDEDFSPADWIGHIDRAGIAQIFLMPLKALMDKTVSAKECVLSLLQYAPDRIRYMTVFHPTMDESECTRVAAELAEEECVGLKIHPAFHRLEAEHPLFDRAYSLAAEAGKPIVTHSWEKSDYNPVQELAHPGRFRKHLAAHPQVTLVLGHAGGRPSTLEAVADICREFPKTMVDISGDYFDNGLIDCLATRLGTDRIMFGSDIDWIDPRCNLGPIFASRLPDEDLLKILRGNARRVFLRKR